VAYSASAPAERACVLVGVWSYRYLEPVPAAENSLRRMEALLGSHLCGWQQGSIYVAGNPQSPGDLPRVLVQRFRTASDVVLFYYVGHGLPDSEDELCLALGETQDDPVDRRTTSLRFDDVRHALRMSRAKTKIVILDCCYAGLAATPGGRLGAANMADLARSAGAYVMAACGEFGLAWFETEREATSPQTHFTKCLADIIEGGIPGEGRMLRLDPLFHRVADELDRVGRPVPVCLSTDYAAGFEFARNAAYVVDGTPDPAPGDTTAAGPRPQPNGGTGTRRDGAGGRPEHPEVQSLLARQRRIDKKLAASRAAAVGVVGLAAGYEIAKGTHPTPPVHSASGHDSDGGDGGHGHGAYPAGHPLAGSAGHVGHPVIEVDHGSDTQTSDAGGIYGDAGG
jgi:hypothetical protein